MDNKSFSFLSWEVTMVDTSIDYIKYMVLSRLLCTSHIHMSNVITLYLQLRNVTKYCLFW